ncbi:flagellar assembly protein FliW [bacterium]|nr:flagellar assembly protein FliW [bacterium]
MVEQKNSKDESAEKKILKTRLGNVEYTDDDIVNFPEGLYGYEEYKRYIVFQHENYMPFSWLLSIDPPGLMFPIVDPKVIMDDYNPKINHGQSIGDILLVIVTIGSENNDVTANLRAPVLIDSKIREGRQVILTDSSYPLRYTINQT